ncbi:MAG: D-ribose pyranase [Brevinema sp.]
MKKTDLLNAPISALIAQLGHTDTIVIADAGLPIPKGILRIDLALTRGIPTFKQVLQVVLTEMSVESYTIASESTSSFEQLCQKLLEKSNNQANGQRISHKDFKQQCQYAQVVIRTGECSPYFNIILHANVSF